MIGETKNMERCFGCAFVFSGRPDPIWQVDEDLVQRLKDIWDELEPFIGQESSKPLLGYRGCSLRCTPGKVYSTYEGEVTKKSDNNIERRKDRARRFEKLLIATAPKGLLPDSLFGL